MKCPHCLTTFHSTLREQPLLIEDNEHWYVLHELCPECDKAIIWIRYGDDDKCILVNPRAISRSPVPKEVPGEFVEDYIEACLTFADSPKASAALSRRCLQNLILEKAGIKKGDLSDEIQQVIDSGKLPSQLSDAIDAVRNIGNFAAHPIKSRRSGEIVDVEPGEAKWNLDTLEGLFDFYFVAPEKLRQKRDALNKKLQDVGKPPMK